MMKREIESTYTAIDKLVSPAGTMCELSPKGDDIPQGDNVWVDG